MADPLDRASASPPLIGMEGSPLDSVMPIVLFIAVDKVLGLPWAIGAATAWSIKVGIQRKRRGSPIGKFLPIITAGIVIRGLVGIATDSEAVYFGIGIATKVAIGLVVIGSALIGRNIVARFAPLVFGFDDATVADPAYTRAMGVIAWAVGLGELASAAFDVWLYNRSSVDGYLVIRFVVNWPLTTAIMLGSIAHLGRSLAHIPGFPGMTALLEERMLHYETAVRSRRRGVTES